MHPGLGSWLSGVYPQTVQIIMTTEYAVLLHHEMDFHFSQGLHSSILTNYGTFRRKS